VEVELLGVEGRKVGGGKGGRYSCTLVSIICGLYEEMSVSRKLERIECFLKVSACIP
jgi:hypothetical protein